MDSNLIRSRFLRSLTYEASRDEIAAIFGEPEGWGSGIDGSLILAFRGHSIEMAPKEGGWLPSRSTIGDLKRRFRPGRRRFYGLRLCPAK